MINYDEEYDRRSKLSIREFGNYIEGQSREKTGWDKHACLEQNYFVTGVIDTLDLDDDNLNEGIAEILKVTYQLHRSWRVKNILEGRNASDDILVMFGLLNTIPVDVHNVEHVWKDVRNGI